MNTGTALYEKLQEELAYLNDHFPDGMPGSDRPIGRIDYAGSVDDVLAALKKLDEHLRAKGDLPGAWSGATSEVLPMFPAE